MSKTTTKSMLKILESTIVIISIAFLGFVAGSFTMFADAFPARHLSNAYQGGMALFEQQTNYRHPYLSRFFQRARAQKAGVTIYDPTRTSDGWTLYTSGHAQKAFLIAMNGEVVHEWSLPFSAVWDDTAAVRNPQPDTHIYYRRAHLYPNGDLLVIYVGAGDTPWGYGLVKMNKDAEVIWSYLEHVHHDLAVADDGKIYALTHEIGTEGIEAWQHLQPPRVDDFVVVLSPDGRELKKVSVLDALVASPYARMLTRTPWYLDGGGDYLHTNSIDVIDRAAATTLPFASEGQILLSMRELGSGALATLDLDKEVITWATAGPWVGQHDPDILPNGNMLLFDNRGHFGPGGTARVIEFDPSTFEIVWSYTGDDQHTFDSPLRSAQERLPNDNTLITESDGGRLFEVTPEGDTVWEFINPMRGGDANEYIPIVSWGQRIDPASLTPDFRRILASNQ